MADIYQYQVGQRWANVAESSLGVGLISGVDARTITVYFPTSDDSRCYSNKNAPLVRVQYKVGDEVSDTDGNHYQVTESSVEQGLLFYQLSGIAGESRELCETQVSGSTNMAEPLTRLFQGQLDSGKRFSLRHLSLQKHKEWKTGPDLGLTGPRVDLIPHQFHIAREIASRTAPRVMLSDEVGLGKTIEAGLIAHHQLLTGRISRVLILVPEPLVHQWLVEMMRRFNLHFRIFDRQQCSAICESQELSNPFTSEQLVLSSLQFFLANPNWADKALGTEWDLVIVDEAHHLSWTPEKASAAYQLVENFSHETGGLLLLTATPEKEGHISHFAQLRLLDPARFHSLDEFVREQQSFALVAEIAERLLDGMPLNRQQTEALQNFLQDPSSQDLISILGNGETPEKSEAAQTLLARLLDRHGTSRVLFRNTRASIKNFPKRQLFSYPLTGSEQKVHISSMATLEAALYPELQATPEQWVTRDPRVQWLVTLLRQLRNEKLLIICHLKETARSLEKYLKLNIGIRCSAFHEDLSIIERDRAAAWFADTEEGAQALVCSEIGSEGRNFQFCSHLVLFDLPYPSDLLEQRIGRLDRIGQKRDISIHAPYLKGTVQEQLFEWYHRGLNGFEQASSTTSMVYSQLFDDFIPSINEGQQAFESFIEETVMLRKRLHKENRQGRNKLLEIQSCGDQSIAQLLERIEAAGQSDDLQHYLEQVFDCFGVDQEELFERTLVLKPGTELEDDFFPLLNEDGIAVTFDRQTALHREDLHFLTWEHPLAQGAMDLVLHGDKGKASVCLLKNKQIKEGTLLVEALFVVQCTAPKSLQLHAYLPETPVRILMDQSGHDLAELVNEHTLNKQLKDIKGEIVDKIVSEYRNPIEGAIQKGSQLAEEQFIILRDKAVKAFSDDIHEEINRLQTLRQTNETIREDEIEQLAVRAKKGTQMLMENTLVTLDAVRVMVAVS